MKDITKFINYIIGFILLIMCIMNIVLVKDLEEKTVDLIELTDIEPEIVFLDSIRPDTMYLTKTEVVKLETIKKDTITKLDSIFISDSVEVFIPISTYHYDTTLAETHISLICEGYDVRLDRLVIENFLSVPTQEKAVKRWYKNLGIGLGLGATYCDGFKILPTIGVYYKLF